MENFVYMHTVRIWKVYNFVQSLRTTLQNLKTQKKKKKQKTFWNMKKVKFIYKTDS